MVNIRGQELFEFTTMIDYDSFSLENQNMNLIPKILESENVKLVSDNENNNEDFTIYHLHFSSQPPSRVVILNQDHL